MNAPDDSLSDSSFAVLGWLFNTGSHTLSELAERERVSAPSMNRTVNALEEIGYVTRTPHDDDGRKINITLSDEGRKIVSATARQRDEWFDHQLSLLSDDERAGLLAALSVNPENGRVMSAMFRSFAVFNYRVWFTGALVSNTGTWMQATALSWVVLTELTDNDAGAMGVTMALQFAPPLALFAFTGLVADRFDRRKLLILTQILLGSIGVVIGALLLFGVMTLPLMYSFALVLGIVAAFDTPARQAFVSDIVTRDYASNAVALNAASFNGARMIGPAVAGLVIVGVGTGWVFVVNAATFAAMIVALLLIRTGELVPRIRAPRSARLADGFRYVLGRADLVVIFVMVFLLGAFRYELSDLRVNDGVGIRSRRRRIRSFELDPRDRLAGRGAPRRGPRPRARVRLVVVGTGMFAIAATVSAFMPTYWLYAATLMFSGFAVVTTLTTANGYVQTTTDPALRGRVLALYMAILMGGTPFGAPIVGWVAATYGPRTAILVGAGAALVACIIGLTWMIASGRFHRADDSRFRMRLDETRPVTIVEPEEFSDEVAGATTPVRVVDDLDSARRR